MSLYRVIGRNLWRQQRRERRELVPGRADGKKVRHVESWQMWRHRLQVEWNRQHPPPLPGEDAGIPRPDLARRTA